jgi:hypothetical protein
LARCGLPAPEAGFYELRDEVRNRCGDVSNPGDDEDHRDVSASAEDDRLGIPVRREDRIN